MSLETSNEPRLFGCHGETDAKKKLFERKAEQHQTRMKVNPFSGNYKTSSPSKLSRDDPNYGKPVAGSKTEKRGLKAAAHINREVALLCEMIYQEGEKMKDGTAVIIFKDLFQIYTRISNKVVGTLLRGRKHGFINFEGETLFQSAHQMMCRYTSSQAQIEKKIRTHSQNRVEMMLSRFFS